jgi:hypothetical protein
MAVLAAGPSFRSRWWMYFHERFPLTQHGMVIAVYAVSTLCHSALLRGDVRVPGAWPDVAAFLTALLFFLQLRVLDEFKDLEDDCRWRPYRPVPRGLVTLRALAVLGILTALVQLLLALSLTPALVLILVGVWAYSGLMGVEFFSRAWLRARPSIYLVSHAIITPLITFYVSAIDWLPAREVPGGLSWLLVMSYVGSSVVEIGRKIRAPADEEPGVQTYTVLWGLGGAVSVWLALLMTMALLAVGAASRVNAVVFVGAVALPLLATSALVGRRFLVRPTPGAGKTFVVLSALWIMGIYLAVGLAPLLVRLWARGGA